MASSREILKPGQVTLLDVRRVLQGSVDVRLDAELCEKLDASAESLRETAGKGIPVYGLNTGFGKLAKTRIVPNKLSQLQRNLVLSHAAGVGVPLEDKTVRLILYLKANALSRGYSGVRADVINALLGLLRHDV